MAKLNQLCSDIAKGLPITHRTGRCLFNELAEDLKRGYALRGRRSAYDLGRRLERHIIPFFGGVQVSKITTSMISEYTLQGQQEGAAAATIHLDLAALKRAFTLARVADRK